MYEDMSEEMSNIKICKAKYSSSGSKIWTWGSNRQIDTKEIENIKKLY